jgi:hypothetical protein
MYKFELAAALAERMECSLIHPNMEPLSFDGAMDIAQGLLMDNPMRILAIPAL